MIAGSPCAQAADWGLAVQVNEGEAVPPTAVLAATLPQGGTVRDQLGWPHVERALGFYQLPDRNWQLYRAVASVGGKNVVTLYGGNALYGMKLSAFPTNPAEIAAFARYAAYVVANDGGAQPDRKAANIPNLEAVTIWNEMNGTFDGGVVQPSDREAAMATLLNAVVPAIRAANPKVKIGAGAFIGFPNMIEWFAAIGRTFNWKTVDWLDIHPYIATAKGAAEWSRELHLMRARGLSNPAYYSEWGGAALVNFGLQNPGADYFKWFLQNVVAADPVVPAGGNYFLLSDLPMFPNQGLTTGPSTSPSYQITPVGKSYYVGTMPWTQHQ